jgi:predicted NBD/HSP70 family sugar kinase
MTDMLPLRPTDRQLVATLDLHGRLSRDRLAALSGLPRSTVADALARLVRHGIVAERPAPEAAGRTGRPPRLLELAAPAGLVGVIAQTHQTLQAAVAGFDGRLLASRLADPYVHDRSAGLGRPGAALLGEALRAADRSPADLACAVIGVPSPVSAAGGPDLAADFGRRLGVPVWIENDANLGALGAAADMADFIYIKLVHGIGAGLVLDRRLYRGTGGLAGELAHIHADADGPLCRCGGRGCLMTRYNAPLLIGMLQHLDPSVKTMTDILALAARRDAGVLRVLRDLGRMLGRSLADFCVYMAPDGIVVEGLLENAAAPVIEGIRETLAQYAPPAVVAQLRVVGGELGQDAELRGGAVLARQNHAAAVAGRASTGLG